MPQKDVRLGTDRRRFIAGALGGAVLGAGGARAQTPPAQTPPAQIPAPPSSPIHGPSKAAIDAQAEQARPGESSLIESLTVSDPGSDFMVDVLKTLDIDYVTVNPGGSIRGLHESIIHYGGNRKPELISVTHEEIGVAICHGYAKAAGKPMMALIYGVIGLQHAAMAVYNAYADRVPIFMLAGNVGDQSKRFGLPSWYHSATDLAPLLSGALKFADRPVEADYIADSFQYAYRSASTPPSGPVLVTIDDWLQENSLGARRQKLQISPYHPGVAPVADPVALAAAAKMLAAAEFPVMVVERTVGNQADMDNVQKLAELLGAAVLNLEARICIATNHPLNLTGANAAVIPQADVILFLGVDDPWGNLNRTADSVSRQTRRLANSDVRTITIGIDDGAAGGNVQDQLHAFDPDLAIQGDPAASLPLLIAAVQREIGADQPDAIHSRTRNLAGQHATLRDRDRREAAIGWDASPVSVARLVASLDFVLAGEQVSVVTNSPNFLNNWPQRLWNIERWNHCLWNSGAGGLGFSVPAAIGVALAHRGQNSVTVALQTDGDFMFISGALWSAAHHRIPLLIVMHNNRAYDTEHMNIQRMANRRQRGVNRTDIGTVITDPNIDYSGLARSLGVWGTGPISDPSKLEPALREALEVVKGGAPALVDVVTQPR